MSYDLDPIVGNWYQHLEKGLDFEVVALDEDNATVEIQYLDGTLDEIGLDDWYELDLEPAEPPEDWSGPVDDEDSEDVEETQEPEPDAGEEDWGEPRPGRSSRRGGTDDFDDNPAADDFDGDWDQ